MSVLLSSETHRDRRRTAVCYPPVCPTSVPSMSRCNLTKTPTDQEGILPGKGNKETLELHLELSFVLMKKKHLLRNKQQLPWNVFRTNKARAKPALSFGSAWYDMCIHSTSIVGHESMVSSEAALVCCSELLMCAHNPQLDRGRPHMSVCAATEPVTLCGLQSE